MCQSAAWLFLCVATTATAPVAVAAENAELAKDEPRQYYDDWVKAASKPYYYCHFYFKRSPTDATYAYYYGIYYPSRGKRVYMYNPQTKRYWGYWENGKYSLLPKEKQKASIDDIAAEDFPKPGKPPLIPDIGDEVEMLPPPADFPKLDDDKP
jgi:hypothetical protein